MNEYWEKMADEADTQNMGGDRDAATIREIGGCLDECLANAKALTALVGYPIPGIGGTPAGDAFDYALGVALAIKR